MVKRTKRTLEDDAKKFAANLARIAKEMVDGKFIKLVPDIDTETQPPSYIYVNNEVFNERQFASPVIRTKLATDGLMSASRIDFTVYPNREYCLGLNIYCEEQGLIQYYIYHMVYTLYHRMPDKANQISTLLMNSIMNRENHNDPTIRQMGRLSALVALKYRAQKKGPDEKMILDRAGNLGVHVDLERIDREGAQLWDQYEVTLHDLLEDSKQRRADFNLKARGTVKKRVVRNFDEVQKLVEFVRYYATQSTGKKGGRSKGKAGSKSIADVIREVVQMARNHVPFESTYLIQETDGKLRIRTTSSKTILDPNKRKSDDQLIYAGYPFYVKVQPDGSHNNIINKFINEYGQLFNQ